MSPAFSATTLAGELSTGGIIIFSAISIMALVPVIFMPTHATPGISFLMYFSILSLFKPAFRVPIARPASPAIFSTRSAGIFLFPLTSTNQINEDMI